MNDAYAAVAQAGASVGVMVVKAGPKKTQKLKPFKVMSPPFEEDVLVDGFYPQMSMRLRCDRSMTRHTNPSATLARRQVWRTKGMVSGKVGLRAWLCNWHVADTERVGS